MANTFKQLREKVLPGQLDRLKKAYEPLRKSDMSKHTDAIKQATAMLNRLSQPGTLVQLSKADIPVVSDVAKNLMKRRGITEDWKDELKNQGNVRVGKTDSQGNWHSVSTSDKKEIEKLKSQGYEVVKEADLSKAQIKMVHKQADELPKNDFIKRYGKDGDAVRFATATNQVKKKLGIEEGGPDKALKKEVITGPGTTRGSNRGGDRGLPVGSIEKGGSRAYTGQKPLWKRALKALDTYIIKFGEEVELEEGTWALPNTSKQAKELTNLLKKPLRADVALDKLYNLIGDDELSDTIEGIKRVDPKTDVRHIVVRRLNKLGFKSFSAESVDEEVELTEKKWPLDMYQGDGANKLNPMVLKIRKLTDRNDHFGARIELAKIAGDKNLQTAYEGLEIAHITAANQAGNHAIILRGKIGPYLRASIVRKFGSQKGPVYASRLMDAL